MIRNLLSMTILATLLLLESCGLGGDAIVVDNTEPISSDNRIIYQLNVGAFTEEGTFKAAQQQLGRLDTLGVDILWLMPIYPRGETKRSPYASMNFRAVNPKYGTVADVKNFVDRAHELGMQVWLDWVPNHVAVENPWVQTHPEYFTKDASGKMIHPHGWEDVFELNYQDSGLVEEMTGAMRFWIDKAGIDGFRCDYVSSPTIPVSYWQQTIASMKSGSDTIEFLSETDISNQDNIRIDSCGFDYDYAWDFQSDLVNRFGAKGYNVDSLTAICQKFLDLSSKIKNSRMVYLTNHDQNFNDGGHTLKAFYGDNRYLLTVLEFTFYGMPLLYQGQEIGDPDTLNYFTDAKVKWNRVDQKMLNTVRTLVALHHTQPSLAADAQTPVFLHADRPHVMSYRRGDVVVVLNLGSQTVNTKIDGLENGKYAQWIDSRTIADGVPSKVQTVDIQKGIELDAKGYAVYVKQ